MHNPFRYFNNSPEVIRLAVKMYVRYPLSLRQVEDPLFERGIDISHEAVLKFLKRMMKRNGRPRIIVANRLRSYGAASLGDVRQWRAAE